MLKVKSISKSVLENLNKLNNAKVHSVFKKVVNFEYNGTLIALQSVEIPKGPLSISIDDSLDFFNFSLNIGDYLNISSKELFIGTSPIKIDSPEVWEPTLEYSPKLFLNDNKILVKSIKSIVIINGKSGGLREAVLSAIANKVPDRKDNDSFVSKLLSEVYVDFHSNSIVEAAKKISNLLGYGAGLTPAGDDFLVGVLSVLHSLKYIDKNISKFHEILSAEIIENSFRTTMISKVFLDEATQGRFSESFHNVYRALSDESLEELYKACATMISIGHSSGTDGLCGLLWAFYLFTNLKK